MEGIDIEITCSVQYQLQRDRDALRALFTRYGGLLKDDSQASDEEGEVGEVEVGSAAAAAYGWTPFYIQSIRGIVRDVMGRYNATALWKDRLGMAAAIRTEAASYFSGQFAVLRGFELLNLDIPDDLSLAILATTVEGERVVRASTELISINETVITQVQVQARLAELQLLTAQAQAVELQTTSQASADAVAVSVEAEAQAVQELKS